MSAALTITRQSVLTGLRNVKSDLRGSRGMMAARGKRLERELRAHFLKKDREPNKKGWPKSHFWNRRIRTSTVLTSVTPSTAEVSIADPAIAQKIHGGTIRPKQAKYLSLPAAAEAQGRSPRLFADLHFEPRRGAKVKGALVNASGKTIYLLATHVTQSPDPTALPTMASLEAADADETAKYLARRGRA